ncbi:MAG: 1-deoxy-D-xylulose-5-phosphate reductoisomerase [Clostridia bacterium]
MKKITILGSTGSIGTQTLGVIAANPDRFCVTALTCGRNTALLAKQIAVFRPRLAVTERREDALALAAQFPQVTFLHGREGLIEAATADCDMVVNALMGMRGLEPTYHAILAGRDIALANKETLVAGGRLVMETVSEKGVRLLPVDSEHSAIFQCLEGNRHRPVKKILLTASGGPFRGFSRAELEHVTPAQALKHPNWSMGAKITIDSATMMNKGLEVIEAKWLFDVPAARIQVLVHPQSILHSAVEFADNSVIGQMGVPDMRIPISLALGYPERLENPDAPLDFFGAGSCLTFEKPDLETFTCLGLAYAALQTGGSCPLVLNAANEVLVDAFLQEKIGFLDIPRKLSLILSRHSAAERLDIEGILEIDRQTRAKTRELL